jgi:5-methylcytosine-specific restriction endonuclease McrA
MPKAYALPVPGEPFDPELFRLGKPCKRNHIHSDGKTLRYRNRNVCPLCERIDSLERQRVKRQDPEQRLIQNARSAAANARRRALHGRESRSKYGLPHGILQKHGLTNRQGPAFAELIATGVDPTTAAALLHSKLQSAGSAPSVAKLVADEQRRYWSEHPDEFADYERERNRRCAQWRHMTDLEYRLYHRQKSKRRKAQMRNSTADQLTGKQVRQRFAQFRYRCAYCDAAGDLHIEHVHPISKGGAHALSNIVPACQPCNFNKCASEVESWYRAQSFFTEKRWQAICAVTDAGLLPAPRQLSLLLA